jgi:tetratricopeptide (TPR) repeat protein
MKALVIEPELLQGYDRLISLFNNPEGREKLVALMDGLISEISKKYPEDLERKAPPLYYAGYAHFLNLDFEECIADLSAAVESNKDYRTGATYYIARAHFALNEYDKAARDFFRIMASDPQGFEYFLRNDPAWQTVIMALSFLSNHAYEAGNLTMARDLIAGLLLVANNSPDFFNNYAFLCRETGKYEEAYEAYREALSLSPDDPSILNDTALILQYHLNRDLDYAKELYLRAVEQSRRIIEDEQASKDEKAAARTALRDAMTNLKKMDRKNKRRRPRTEDRG